MTAKEFIPTSGAIIAPYYEDRGQGKFRIQVPSNVDFADLELRRNQDGSVSFKWEPIEAICEASGVSSDLFRLGGAEDIACLFVVWYVAHLARGGAKDAVQEELLSDARTAHWGSQQYTFKPGHA